MLGNEGDSSAALADQTTETYDTASKKVCDIKSYFEFTGGQSGGVLAGARCDTVFGKGICCGGITKQGVNPDEDILLSDRCGFYDCFPHQWATIQDIPTKVYATIPAVITNERGRDIGWMWFGGSTEHSKLFIIIF